MHVVNTHNHALRYIALHFSCSMLCLCVFVCVCVCVCLFVCLCVCSLCTMSEQRSVAQSACVLRALCPRQCVFYGQGGCGVHVR